MAGFSQKNFPASLRQKYVFLVPFSVRINTIRFHSPYFIKNWFGGYLWYFMCDFWAFMVPLIPIHSLVSLKFSAGRGRLLVTSRPRSAIANTLQNSTHVVESSQNQSKPQELGWRWVRLCFVSRSQVITAPTNQIIR